MVLFFGEIIPQALCSRYGLAIGAYSSTFVRILMLVCGIVAYPISLVLDFLLGKEHSVSNSCLHLHQHVQQMLMPALQSAYLKLGEMACAS